MALIPGEQRALPTSATLLEDDDFTSALIGHPTVRGSVSRGNKMQPEDVEGSLHMDQSSVLSSNPETGMTEKKYL